MDTNELLKGISEAGKSEKLNKTDVNETIRKLIVFRINKKVYALYADKIREIVLDVPLFYVPFVPSYIRGFINRHGEPYTVFDLNMLFEQKKLESSTFFIMNIEDDQVAFMINDVLEIQKTPESHIHKVTLRDENEDFFVSSITSEEGEEIFILNTEAILKRLERDLNAD
ncbi:MAG: chemotaxis protein CheW [Spirochaetales bacterium]|nr:chemotaxis protein CheW [Spirochaetales bacterium]